MQRVMDQVSQPCGNYDLTISRKKTEVVQQPALGKPNNENHHCEWTKKWKLLKNSPIWEALVPE